MSIEVFDVLALIFGIWLNVRKLDTRKLSAADYPTVRPEDFERWQNGAASNYSLGSLVCFLKLGLDILLRLGGVRGWFPWTLVRVMGVSLFLGWVATLVFVGVRAHRAGKLRDELGIGRRPPPRFETREDEPPEPGSDEN
jgi:hypothetical protein